MPQITHCNEHPGSAGASHNPVHRDHQGKELQRAGYVVCWYQGCRVHPCRAGEVLVAICTQQQPLRSSVVLGGVAAGINSGSSLGVQSQQAMPVCEFCTWPTSTLAAPQNACNWHLWWDRGWMRICIRPVHLQQPSSPSISQFAHTCPVNIAHNCSTPTSQPS